MGCGITSSCTPLYFPGGETSLSGCMQDYASDCVGGLRLPENAHLMSPWVEIEFEGSGSVITVGNDSSPNTNPKNVACIRSFEFGYSDGLTVRVTVHDEQGGSFVKFMENMVKHYACLREGSPASVRMKFRFGWVKSGCQSPLPMSVSRCFYALCDSVETSLTEGKYIYELTGKDLPYRMFEGGSEMIFGGEGENGVHITEAITQLMTQTCSPNVGSVRFLTMENGVCKPLEFKEGGEKGPKGKWICNGQDKLTAAKRWLDGYTTKNDRGFIPQYNCEAEQGEIIFWEDTKPQEPQPDEYWNKQCIGVYIVNGGNRSSVIEFNPKIRWDFSRLASVGGAIGSSNVNGLSTDGSKNPGRQIPTLDRQMNPCAGQMIQTTSTESHRDLYGERELVEKQKADDEAQRALKILHDNIESDLVIVGDPTVAPPSEAMWSKSCTIVVINPFFLTMDGDAQCGTWLSQPTCNNVLSSKAWIIKSVTHRIENGSYTTTLGVYLAAPGIDTPAGTQIGAWTNGWTPPTVC